MLNKRFKIAKCKTSLKLATSRIKLMRNKKVIQINQMKKELAQLLESQQDRTARIRVEHVIREEKMVAAYDLVEIYCELIVARLPIIESQKTCPIDLKEAVTSVIFAAPRCSDIPELADARKNFTAKYGKEFVSAATELRPDCGVSRMLVEKLSAVAPDVQTKMKVLTAVAKEHNINWDPTSFEEKESKPPDDLLNGPTNFEKASTMSVDPPKIQTTGVPNVPRHEGNPNVPLNFTQQNKRYTSDAQNLTPVDTGGVQTSFSSTTHDDMRPSGMAPGMMNTSQSFHSNKNEPWNMEFKDATSAAQAAAESAERASIAARAAAQLSSQGKITRQYSTESHESHTRHEKPQVLYNYNNSSFNDRKPKIQNQQMGTTQDDISPKANKKSSRLRSRSESVNESSANHFHQADGYFEIHEDHVPSSPKMRSKNKSKDQFTSSDMLSSDPRKVGQKIAVDKGSHSRETTKTSFYGDARKDDETDSDDDGDVPRFDMGFEYDDGEAKSFFPSPERESFRLTEKTQVSGLKKNMINTTGQVRISKSRDHSLQSDLSNGPDSDSENELENSRFSSTKKFTTSHKHDVFSTNPVPTRAESPPKVNSRKSRVELNDLVKTGRDSESEEEMGKSSFSNTNFTTPHKHAVFSKDPEPAHVESSPKGNPRKSRVELNDLVKTDQYSESEKEMGKSSFSSTKFSTPHKHGVFATNPEPAHVEFSPKAHSRKSRVELNDLVKTGRDSESENEIGKSSFSSTKFTTPHKPDVFSTHHEPSYEESSPKANSRKSRIELNDLVETGQDSESDSETGNSSFGVTKKLSSPHNRHGVFSTNLEPTYIESSPKANSRKSRVELNDSVETGSSFNYQSDVLDTGSDFKYGTLTGGLRNKGGLMHPPYTKVAVKESPVKVDSTSKQSSYNKKPSVSIGSESDSDDYSEKLPVQSSKTRSHFAPPDVFFNTDETDSEEEVTPVRKQTYTNKVHSGSGLSRRTKGQVEPVSKTVISSQSPGGPRSDAKNFTKNPDTNRESLETSSTSGERQPSTSSNSTKSHLEPRPDPARVKQEPSQPDPARVKQEPSRADPARFKQEPLRPDPERFKKEHSRPDPVRFNKEDSRTMSEPKISEKPQIPPRKVQESGKPEAPKTANSSSNTSPEVTNVKKPSHVHPKLPEYDSLAARIQALSKMNH